MSHRPDRRIARAVYALPGQIRAPRHCSALDRPRTRRGAPPSAAAIVTVDDSGRISLGQLLACAELAGTSELVARVDGAQRIALSGGTPQPGEWRVRADARGRVALGVPARNHLGLMPGPLLAWTRSGRVVIAALAVLVDDTNTQADSTTGPEDR